MRQEDRRWLVVVGALVAIGIAARIVQYAHNPSLSVDEALLALNVMRRSVPDLLGTLDFNQAAPPGFLVLEKAATSVFGNGEYWLRLVPLLAGVASLVVFPFLAREVLGRWASAVAVGLFAFSDSAIYYAGTAKQYSLDVAAAVLLSWLACRSLAQRTTRRLVTLITVGAVAVWLSHPAAFVLLAIGLTLGADFVRARDGRQARVVAVGVSMWLVSFAISYGVTRPSVSHVAKSFSGSAGFVGGGAGGSSTARDYLGVFRYEAGIPHFSLFGLNDPGHWVAALAAALLVIGLVALCRLKPAYAAVLFGPVAIALVASAFHRYPLTARTFLFAVPAAAIGMAAGATLLLRAARPSLSWPVAGIAVGLIGISLVVPLARGFEHPRTKEELKPVLRYLARAQRPGDSLYLYYTSQYGFRYYLSCGCFDSVAARPRRLGWWPLTKFIGGPGQWSPALVSRPPNFRVGLYRGSKPAAYVQELSKLRGRARVWVILSNLPDSDRRFLLGRLDQFGRLRSAFRAGSDESAAGVYLYDLR